MLNITFFWKINNLKSYKNSGCSVVNAGFKCLQTKEQKGFNYQVKNDYIHSKSLGPQTN